MRTRTERGGRTCTFPVKQATETIFETTRLAGHLGSQVPATYVMASVPPQGFGPHGRCPVSSKVMKTIEGRTVRGAQPAATTAGSTCP